MIFLRIKTIETEVIFLDWIYPTIFLHSPHYTLTLLLLIQLALPLSRSLLVINTVVLRKRAPVSYKDIDEEEEDLEEAEEDLRADEQDDEELARKLQREYDDEQRAHKKQKTNTGV